MSKNTLIILILILTSSLFLVWKLFFNLPPSQIVSIDIKGQKYKIELAKTSAQKMKGLGNRTSLCQNCGMIFIFGFETKLPFWMKDTLIPLDMIWLDSTGKVVDIQTIIDLNNTKKVYQNQTPAQYVLELNANDSQKLGLNIGDIIKLPNFNE
jgi:uncharacterized membrane protein (UPF0127 family)